MPTNSDFGLLNYSILTIYLVAMFACGIFMAGRQHTSKDYFLAGGKMPWLVVAMSMFASLTSATSYMGYPGAAYRENCSMLMVGIASVLVAPILIYLFYPFYRQLGVTTSFEYIGHRFGTSARLAVSALFVLARVGWLGVVIYSPAFAISVVTGLNVYIAVLLMGALAVSYTAVGGLAAVLWTDLLQFVILTAGAVWVATTLALEVPDGISGILQTAEASGRLFNWNIGDFTSMSATVILIAYFFNHMQDYGADQITVQRMMSIGSAKGMNRAVWFFAVFEVLILGLLLFIGLGLFAYYQRFPDLIPAEISGDKVLPYYIIHALPNGISGLLITALFAAAMSSMDSGINSLATVVVNDFLRPFRKTAKPESYDLLIARAITLVLGALAIAAACFAATIEEVLKAALIFLGLFTGPILAIFLLGMLTRKGSLAAWTVGAVISITATAWLQTTEAHWTCYFPFNFGICFGISLTISQIIPGKMADRDLTIWRT